MPARNYKSEFSRLSEEFPVSSIVVSLSDNTILYSYNVLNQSDDFSPQDRFCEVISGSDGMEYYRFQIKLTEYALLSMLLPKNQVSSTEEIIYRLILLRQDLSGQSLRHFKLPFTGKYRFLMNHMLNKYAPGTEDVIGKLAKECSVDITVPRILCLVSFWNRDDNSEIKKDTVVRDFIDLLQLKMLMQGNDLIYCESSNELVLMKEALPSVSVRKQLMPWLKEILDLAASEYSLHVRIAVSFIIYNISEYQKNFRTVRTLLSTNGIQDILFADENIPAILLEYTPSKILEHYFSKYVNALEKQPELTETMRQLIDNGMNINQAAQNNHMHRNTMLQHTRQLRDILGLDPINRESDRLTMEILCNYIQKTKVPVQSGDRTS